VLQVSFKFGFFTLMALLSGAPASAATTTQTIAFIRHGEKPEGGLGQLNCQGLNRALALPSAITALLGKPDVLFASNPSERKKDSGVKYDYIRPLATIEPTAIALGLPVNTQFGFSDTDGLKKALEKGDLTSAVVLVAWEHHEIETVARDLMKSYDGNPDTIPQWKGTDFDSVFVLKIQRGADKPRISFELGHENLNGQPQSCPNSK